MTISLEAAVEQWLRGYRSHATRRTYKQSLSSFVAHCTAQLPLDCVTPEMVDNWFYDLSVRQTIYEDHPSRPQENRELSLHTLANYARHTRTFFNWCVRRRYIAESPAMYLRCQKPKDTMDSKAMPMFVLQQMLVDVTHKPEFFKLRDGAILSMLATYGTRCGSLASLTIPQINFLTGWITTRQKGDRNLNLPIVPPIENILRKWLAHRETLNIDPPHDYVFVTTRKAQGNAHQRLTELGLQQIIYRLSEQADPTGHRWGPHSVRHWRGQSLADDRVSPKLIQQLLGHSDIKITLDSYCNQDRKRLRALTEEHVVVPDM